MKTFYLISVLLCASLVVFGQNFKGKISFATYYLDKETMEPIVPTVMEEVWMSDELQKIDVLSDSTKTGGLDWQIFNYKTGILYSKEHYPTAKITQSKICDNKKGEITHEVLDTTINFKGLVAKVMIVKKKGVKIAEFYYTNEYKTSPAYYACPDRNVMSYCYNVTKGGFLLQFVEFGDLYTAIYQVQEISAYDVPEKEFAVPAN